MDTDKLPTDPLTEIQKTLQAMVQELSSLRSDLSSLQYSVREELTKLQTELRFANTIDRAGYRPEFNPLEPLGNRLVRHKDAFTRRPSPYRRYT